MPHKIQPTDVNYQQLTNHNLLDNDLRTSFLPIYKRISIKETKPATVRVNCALT